jgi:hypothetical protein
LEPGKIEFKLDILGAIGWVHEKFNIGHLDVRKYSPERREIMMR